MLADAQAQQAAQIVLGDLATQGLPTPTAETLLGPALTPGAVDVLAVLGQP
jgi:hypothetical protein